MVPRHQRGGPYLDFIHRKNQKVVASLSVFPSHYFFLSHYLLHRHLKALTRHAVHTRPCAGRRLSREGIQQAAMVSNFDSRETAAGRMQRRARSGADAEDEGDLAGWMDETCVRHEQIRFKGQRRGRGCRAVHEPELPPRTKGIPRAARREGGWKDWRPRWKEIWMGARRRLPWQAVEALFQKFGATWRGNTRTDAREGKNWRA
ncbi:hypothetical protein C2845_PM01G35430 [Panicum miliaceum]|uniref:Uncharacterized protein n=1 Tax=Panicum miliaceum TaxID=4540 RepID=A0A3L6TST5_PANMI|nr:hypothetical protein C2845_PM01G35430 [Panicum miliaceum]